MEFRIIKADITNLEVGAVVLPANKYLKEGSGASEAIFKKAGEKQLKEECAKLAPIDVGFAVPTAGFNLPAEFIIHAVVPKWKGGNENEYAYLSAAYLTSLKVADTIGLESIAFPLLAAGNNGFDPRVAFEIAKRTINEFQPEKNLKDVYLTVYSKTAEALILSLGECIDEGLMTKTKFPVALKAGVAAVAGDVLEGLKEYWEKHKKEIIDKAIKTAFDALLKQNDD